MGYLLKNSMIGRILCKYSDRELALAVKDRSADAAIMNRLQAKYVVSEFCGIHRVPGIDLNTKPYALPVQKGWIADYAEFNRWLVQLVMDGTVDRLVKKWFHSGSNCGGTSTHHQLDYDNFYGLSIVLLIGIFL